MNKNLALMLVLVFLTATCVTVDKPVFAASAVGNSWVEMAPMNYARSSLGVIGLNGRIYAIGGNNEEASGGSELMPAQTFSGGIIGVNEEYDPSTNNWTLKAPMPIPKENFAIAAYQNKIYCIGGSDRGNEVYDTTTNTWKSKASMPTDRTFLQANVVDGKIYCIGGASNGQYSNVNEVYDPATNTWTTKSPMPSPTGDYASAVFDGKIYIIGGYNGYAGVDLTQIYNPQNDSWTFGAPPPVGEISVGVSTIGIMAPERIYVFSGRTQIYNPYNNSWSLGTPVPENIGGAAANANDLLYVIGGVTFTGDLNGDISSETEYALNEQYTPIGYGTPDPNYVLGHTPPQISLLSPLNQTYSTSSVGLVFSVDKDVNWTAYSLDGQQNITVTGNTTLTGLPNGLHNIAVYANDTYGNIGSSQTVNFTVEIPQALGSGVKLAVIVIPIVVVCIGICLLIYRKRRKR
jgi:hypothetical protein